ncbi:12808_t:CDS:2, partial [Dentiscutata erythropus]
MGNTSSLLEKDDGELTYFDDLAKEEIIETWEESSKTTECHSEIRSHKKVPEIKLDIERGEREKVQLKDLNIYVEKLKVIQRNIDILFRNWRKPNHNLDIKFRVIRKNIKKFNNYKFIGRIITFIGCGLSLIGPVVSSILSSYGYSKEANILLLVSSATGELLSLVGSIVEYYASEKEKQLEPKKLANFYETLKKKEVNDSLSDFQLTLENLAKKNDLKIEIHPKKLTQRQNHSETSSRIYSSDTSSVNSVIDDEISIASQTNSEKEYFTREVVKNFLNNWEN